MLSMAIQPGVNGAFRHPSFPPQKLGFKPLNVTVSVKPKVSSLHLSTFEELKTRPTRREVRLSVSAVAAEAIEEETSTEDSTPQDSDALEGKEKLKVVVKPMEKPRLVLKFVWLEKNIGLALDQKIPGHGTIPLSPYYFWPRKDAWEELKSLLETKPWISQKRMIILLNQATDVINLWQQSDRIAAFIFCLPWSILVIPLCIGVSTFVLLKRGYLSTLYKMMHYLVRNWHVKRIIHDLTSMYSHFLCSPVHFCDGIPTKCNPKLSNSDNNPAN